MRQNVSLRLGLVAVFCLFMVVTVAANEPMFVRWLVADDAGDQTIRAYWQRAEAGQLEPSGMVDLGTMLFYRGYPKDAVRYFRRALKEDPGLYEAWFRIGLVEHRDGNLRDARLAYSKCLKILTGHGWCNFYMGLLQEQKGRPSRAIHYYRRAFKFAPELADPAVNPEVLYSKLELGAVIRRQEMERFQRQFPMAFMDPAAVQAVREQFGPVEAKAAPDDVPPPPPPPPMPDQDATDEPVKKPARVEVLQPAGSGGDSKAEPGATAPTAAAGERSRVHSVKPDRPRVGQPQRQPPRPTPAPSPEQPPSVTSVSPEASLLPFFRPQLPEAGTPA